jgi:hypothetical protein
MFFSFHNANSPSCNSIESILMIPI